MSNIHEFPRYDQRYDEASEWIAKLDKDLSAADQEAFQEWMAADRENQAVLLEMASLWDEMGVLSLLSDLFPEAAARPGRSHWFAVATAASVLIAVFAGVWAVIAFNPGNAPDARQAVIETASDTVYETAIGEQSTVHLTDGTQLVLNTNSLVNVNYTDQYRLLRLERGEIHVQVAHDKARPLSVIVGDTIVKAVGTAFSLEIASNQQIELVVTEGKVLVGVHQSTLGGTANNSPDISASTSVTVVAGEQLILGIPEEEITEVSPEEIEVKLSWREGNLIFRGESLEDAVAEIGRYTTVEFVILDDDLRKVRIAGLFKAGDVDGLLATLRENFNISYQRTGDGKIMLTSL
jgi:transmembrane sensor